MTVAAALTALQKLAAKFETDPPVSDQIKRFLSGESDGRALFVKLYGELVEEAIPDAWKALLRGKC